MSLSIRALLIAALLVSNGACASSSSGHWQATPSGTGAELRGLSVVSWMPAAAGPNSTGRR